MPNSRSRLAKATTFVRFAAQQIAARARVAREVTESAALPFTIAAPSTVLTAADPEWRDAGLRVKAGEHFVVSARGAVWLSKPLSVVMQPRACLWVRIAGAPEIHKPADHDHVFVAWADGEVQLFLKALSEWASPAGDLLAGDRPAMAGEIAVRVAPTDLPATAPLAPDGWSPLWRMGDGTVYARGDAAGEIRIHSHGDVGILQTEVNHPITPATRLQWSWKVERLPSRLAEDTVLTHDYLSVAVEFDNGQDLTFMWSAGLPHDHVFTCPLNWWCERETHWVVRTPRDGVGVWLDEDRGLWADTQTAYGVRPARAVRLWLIANSIFQRQTATATIRDLRLVEAV
jgi:hypothetical protein